MQALSPTDSAFLWMETRNQPMHVAGLSIYTPPPGSGPDYVSKLLAAWGKYPQAVAPFNLRPVLRMGLWYWEEDTEFELDYHLRHLALPQPGRIRELLAMVSRLHGNLLDRNRPLWETYVIEGLPGGRFATYSKIHHALVDGVTGARMAANAMCLNATEHKPPTWAIPFTQHPAGRRKSAPPGLLQQPRPGKKFCPVSAAGCGTSCAPATPIARRRCRFRRRRRRSMLKFRAREGLLHSPIHSPGSNTLAKPQVQP